jgi:F-type H+-transporting ATPase subunit delta
MASVVGVYARAFADVVVKSKLDPTRALQELHEIDALLRESIPFRRVLLSPAIPADRKQAVLDAVAQRTGMTRQARNFVAVITDHQRLSLFTDILKQLQQELNDRFDIADAEVVSARELTEAERKLLEGQVATLSGKRVRAQYRQDPSLLGGALVKIGSTIYDGSVREQLQKIREQLVEN